MPGGDLLFHCLGSSTIGAVWFHVRVRDGIGWVTDAMVTKLWSQRVGNSRNRADLLGRHHLAEDQNLVVRPAGLTMMVGLFKREQSN